MYVDDVLRHTWLHFLNQTLQPSGLWSSAMLLRNSGSGICTCRWRGLLSKAAPHHGNQPYCSCHGKQAPRPLVLHCYRCRTLGVRKDGWSANASHFSRSCQATIVRAGADSAAAADLGSFVVHSRSASTISPSSLSHSCLLLLLAWVKLASLMTAGGYPAPHHCVWGGGGRVPGEEKLAQSSGHVLCCCCLLKEGSCLPFQEQNCAFAYCAADSPTATPTWEQKY